MDPDACVARAVDAMHADDLEEAEAAVFDYIQWRSRGGTRSRHEARLHDVRTWCVMARAVREAINDDEHESVRRTKNGPK